MLHCPNLECPFHKKFGRPAEYRAGFSTCSDCGAALAEGAAPVAPVAASVPIAPPAGNVASDAGARLAVTLFVMAAVAAAVRVPMLGVTFFDSSSRGLLGMFGGEHSAPGMFSIGLVPFVTGFQFIELVALLPFLAERRLGTPEQRRPLTTAAIVVGLLLLVVQASSVNAWAQGLATGAFPMAKVAPWLLVALVVPTLALVAAAWVVDRRGLGNGFAVVLAATALSNVVTRVGPQFFDERLTPLAAALALIGAVGAVALLIFVTGWPSQRGVDGPRWVPLPLSGVFAITLAGAVMSLPSLLGGWGVPGVAALEREVRSSMFNYVAVLAFFTLDIALVLGFLFFRPAAVRAQWARWQPTVSGDRVQEVARRALPGALGLSVAVLVVPLLLGNWLLSATGASFGSLVELAALVVLADLVDEFRARQRFGTLIAVTAVHRVTEVEPLLLELEQAGIPVHAKSARYRAMLRFFGPYTPIEVLVPQARAADAKALLK